MGETAPLVGAPAAAVPAGASAEWVAGAGGLRLRTALFPATVGAPRGSVVVSGGRTEPIEKYFETIEALRARGFAVLAHDWRGQGLSGRLLADPLKGHAVRAQDFVDDFAAVLSAFEARLPRPWIALSHSMGACLTLLALAGGERRFAGAALSAPMLGLVGKPAPVWIARLASRVAVLTGQADAYVPGHRVSPDAPPFEDNIVTHDRARYEREQAVLAACPALRLSGPTYGWLAFAFAAMDALARPQAAAAIATPVTMAAAGDDRLVDNRPAHALAARLKDGRCVEIAGAFHEILQETDALRARFWTEFDALAERVV